MGLFFQTNKPTVGEARQSGNSPVDAGLVALYAEPGTLRTHWRMGWWGRISSTRSAAPSAILRAPQLGQKPRFLQLKATNFSSWQVSHLTLKKPCSSLPHFRYSSNSFLTYDLPPVASLAQAQIDAAGMTDQITVVSGDFFHNELPKADVITMGNILHWVTGCVRKGCSNSLKFVRSWITRRIRAAQQN